MRTGTRLLSAILFASLPFAGVCAEEKETVPLSYLRPGQPDAAALLTPPPLANSGEETADMEEIVSVVKNRSAGDESRSEFEKKFTAFTFAPAIGDFFQTGKVVRAEAFFAKVLKDAAAATDSAKQVYKRPRPYTINPALANLKLEKTFSYPSGHSAESMVLALLLADVFPERSNAILEIARGIRWHRVQMGRHYPTDIYAGRVFAKAIVRELKTNPEFVRDFQEVTAELRTASLAASKPAEPAQALAR